MSDPDQPPNAHQPDQNRSRCWIFSLNLDIRKPLTTEEGSDLISPDFFNKVLDNCLPYQNSFLKLAVLSYSFDPEWSQLLPGNALGVTGLIVNTTKLCRKTVENWMTHEVSRPQRGQRCQRAEDFLDAKTQRSFSLKIQMLYYVKESHTVNHMMKSVWFCWDKYSRVVFLTT